MVSPEKSVALYKQIAKVEAVSVTCGGVCGCRATGLGLLAMTVGL